MPKALLALQEHAESAFGMLEDSQQAKPESPPPVLDERLEDL
jgi:hypothetical protein